MYFIKRTSFLACLTFSVVAQSLWAIPADKTGASASSEFERAYSDSDFEREASAASPGRGNQQNQLKTSLQGVESSLKLGAEPLPVEDYPQSLKLLVEDDGDFRLKDSLLREMRFEDISSEDVAALMSFLLVRKVDEYGAENLQHLSHKNDALVCLLDQSPMPEDLGKLMLKIVHDESEDIVWREYVLQYFAEYYRSMWPIGDNAGNPDMPLRRAMQRTLAQALFMEDSPLSGTALIVLNNLADDYPEFGRGVMAKASRRLAASPEACTASCITALSLLPDAPENEDVLMTSDIAQNSSAQYAVRVAAAGRLAKWSERNHPLASERLRALAITAGNSKSDNRIRNAAQSKLDKIQLGE
ncbi:hypothetical protein [Cerasicoccus maritimus]|uniref:hypothetical protein n=1 Tax=Cerasicoccus maritimus TaxID=490089 RepID=UPI002852B65F|nr:hypothetical protein [Cerasicoccus maritimus]